MADPKLHERDWRHPNYDREMKAKILQAKFRALVLENKNGDRQLTVVEEKLVQSAALLTLTTYLMEQDFILQDAAAPAREYLPALNALRATLDKLGVYPKQEDGNKGGDLLASIINS